jgi:hypothetical protein
MSVEEMKAAVEAEEIEQPTLCRHGTEPLQCDTCSPKPQPEEHAPLFVKVEKYREVLGHIGEIKTFVNGVKQIFVLQDELDGVRTDALRMLRSSIQRLERSIEEVDSGLLRPVGLEVFPHGDVEMKHVEESLTRLRSQLSNLRKELEGLKTSDSPIGQDLQ